MATSAQVADLMFKRLNLRGVDRNERFDRPRHPGRIVTVESTGPKVAALYVDPNGVYANLPNVEVWDAARDARLYAGPWPVVAHPPCNRWCRLAGQIETRYGYAVGDDGGCFAAAVDAVRRFGGVLEHPAYSHAWRAFNLPRPMRGGGWAGSLDDPGWSCHVAQGHYGHEMVKETWLYAVGVDLAAFRWGQSDGRRLRHREPELSATQRERMTIPTPSAFRDLLLAMAASARQPAALPG